MYKVGDRLRNKTSNSIVVIEGLLHKHGCEYFVVKFEKLPVINSGRFEYGSTYLVVKRSVDKRFIKLDEQLELEF